MNTEDSEFERIEREAKLRLKAMRGVPDPIHHTDPGETMEYIQGWNDCRQVMLEQPEHHDPIGDAQDKLIAEQAAQPYKGIADHTNQVTNGRMRIDPVTGDVGIGTPSPQAQRTWVGLTDEEVEGYWDWEDFQCGCGRGTLFEMVRDIEAKLKEKNT